MYDETVAAGRVALSQGAWSVARARFEAALEETETPQAYEGLSWATWWLEEVPACLNAREQARQALADRCPPSAPTSPTSSPASTPPARPMSSYPPNT
jgi:uncharacterized protein HemY